MSFVIRFGKRHKKKLIFTAVLFGGGYATVKYTINKFKKTFLMSSEEVSLANKEYERSRKQQHYLSIKQTSDEAILGLVKSIEDQINQVLSSDEYLDQLKQKPSNKLELWEKMKILSVSKCLTTIYALSILSVLVKVELNVIGGHLFKSNSNEMSFFDFESQKKSHDKLSPSIQKKYLENIEVFVRDGVPKLASRVKECVEEIFGKLSLKENIDIAYFNDKLETVRESVEIQMADEFNFVLEYLNLSFNKIIKETSNDLIVEKSKLDFMREQEILFNLNNETLDLIQCDDFNQTFRSIFDGVKNDFLNNLSSLMLKQIMDKESSEKITITLPFAKLIPILNQIKFTLHQNVMLNNLKLNIFSANIYEAFSYVEEGDKSSVGQLADLDINSLIKTFL